MAGSQDGWILQRCQHVLPEMEAAVCIRVLDQRQLQHHLSIHGSIAYRLFVRIEHVAQLFCCILEQTPANLLTAMVGPAVATLPLGACHKDTSAH